MLKLDEQRLRNTVTQIRKLIGYDTYDVTLILVDDDEMSSINQESRGIAKPTDILSFPFHDAVKAGVLEDVEFDIPDMYMLVRTIRRWLTLFAAVKSKGGMILVRF